MGPAVLNGGFSTFLAVVLLSVSDVYVLKTFFKVTSMFRVNVDVFKAFFNVISTWSLNFNVDVLKTFLR